MSTGVTQTEAENKILSLFVLKKKKRLGFHPKQVNPVPETTAEKMKQIKAEERKLWMGSVPIQ